MGNKPCFHLKCPSNKWSHALLPSCLFCMAFPRALTDAWWHFSVMLHSFSVVLTFFKALFSSSRVIYFAVDVWPVYSDGFHCDIFIHYWHVSLFPFAPSVYSPFSDLSQNIALRCFMQSITLSGFPRTPFEITPTLPSLHLLPEYTFICACLCTYT